MSIIGKPITSGGGKLYTGQTTVTPSTSNITLQTNKLYLKSNITVYGDADLVSGNIRNGVNIFGVTGNVRAYGHSSGSFNITSSTATFYDSGTTAVSAYYFSKSGIGFTPIMTSYWAWNKSMGSSIKCVIGTFSSSSGNTCGLVLSASNEGRYWVKHSGDSWSFSSSLVRLPAITGNVSGISGGYNIAGYY